MKLIQGCLALALFGALTFADPSPNGAAPCVQGDQDNTLRTCAHLLNPPQGTVNLQDYSKSFSGSQEYAKQEHQVGTLQAVKQRIQDEMDTYFAQYSVADSGATALSGAAGDGTRTATVLQQVQAGDASSSTYVGKVCNPVANDFTQPTQDCGKTATVHVDPNANVFFSPPATLENAYISGAYVQALSCYYHQVTGELVANASGPYPSIHLTAEACGVINDQYEKLKASFLAQPGLYDILPGNCPDESAGSVADALGVDVTTNTNPGDRRQTCQYLRAERDTIEALYSQLLVCEINSRAYASWSRWSGDVHGIFDAMNQDIYPKCHSRCWPDQDACPTSCYGEKAPGDLTAMIQNNWPNSGLCKDHPNNDVSKPSGSDDATDDPQCRKNLLANAVSLESQSLDINGACNPILQNLINAIPVGQACSVDVLGVLKADTSPATVSCRKKLNDALKAIPGGAPFEVRNLAIPRPPVEASGSPLALLFGVAALLRKRSRRRGLASALALTALTVVVTACTSAGTGSTPASTNTDKLPDVPNTAALNGASNAIDTAAHLAKTGTSADTNAQTLASNTTTSTNPATAGANGVGGNATGGGPLSPVTSNGAAAGAPVDTTTAGNAASQYSALAGGAGSAGGSVTTTAAAGIPTGLGSLLPTPTASSGTSGSAASAGGAAGGASFGNTTTKAANGGGLDGPGSLKNDAIGEAYGSGGKGGGVSANGAANPFDSLAAGLGGAGGAGGVGDRLSFSSDGKRSPASGPDRSDYWGLIDPRDSIFKVVHRCYEKKTIAWRREASLLR